MSDEQNTAAVASVNPAWERLGAMLMPLLTDYAVGNIHSSGLKHLLFILVAALGSEGQVWCAKSQTILDDAMWGSLVSEANAAFVAAGHPDLAIALDEFVQFSG